MHHEDFRRQTFKGTFPSFSLFVPPFAYFFSFNFLYVLHTPLAETLKLSIKVECLTNHTKSFLRHTLNYFKILMFVHFHDSFLPEPRQSKISSNNYANFFCFEEHPRGK